MRPLFFLITALVIFVPTATMADVDTPWWDTWRGPTAAWMARAIIQNTEILESEVPDESGLPLPPIQETAPEAADTTQIYAPAKRVIGFHKQCVNGVCQMIPIYAP